MATSQHPASEQPAILSLALRQRPPRGRGARPSDGTFATVTSEISLPISVSASSPSADRLLASLARGNHCFVLTSVDGDVAVRINVVIDRRSSTAEQVSQLGDVVIDWERGTLERNAQRVLLSRTELRLLSCLLESPGEVVPHDRLIASAWPDAEPDDGHNALAVYVCYLRRRLKAVGLGSALHTVRKAGYVLSIKAEGW